MRSMAVGVRAESAVIVRAYGLGASRRTHPSARRGARSVGGGIPVVSAADLHLERNKQLSRTGHPTAHDLLEPVPLALDDLEDQLIVHLQQHPRTQFGFGHVFLDADHR